MSIVGVAIFFGFIQGYNSINRTEIKSELQEECENAMNSISKAFMQGKDLTEVKYLNFDNRYVKSLKLNLDDDEYFLFTLDKSNLICKKHLSSKKSNFVVASDIKYLKVVESEDKKGVNIEICLEKKKISYKANDHIYFRNYNNSN